MRKLPGFEGIVGWSWLAVLVSLTSAQAARAEIKTEEIEYKQGDTPLQGFVAWDTAQTGKRPAVLIVHEWWGHNQHVRNQALRLAKAGYVAFALDMYGKGKVTTHPADAKTFMQEASADFPREKARFDAALAKLKQRPDVDATKLAAIGYCFGGGVVLDMLRSGESFALVATFHGSLSSKLRAKPGNPTRVLVLHGADDPMIPREAVAGFKKELEEAHWRYEVIEYPGAKHGFTNPDADKAGLPGLAYDAKADEASFAVLLKALQEQVGSKKR
ncbi:MAG: dienelactone hydrolase family protein [Polyangiales bacterium]